MEKKDEMLMKTEMRMLQWIQGVSLRDHEIKEAATVRLIATHLMQFSATALVWRCKT